MSSRFQLQWKQTAARLGLDVDCPFSLSVGDGRVTVPVRLKHFGGQHGMLLVTDFSLIRSCAQELVDMGFGFSCLSETSDSEAVDDDVIIEVLRDWGWAGVGDPPAWLESTAS